jgi:PIN domain nuclease of toxin-antitoxin system
VNLLLDTHVLLWALADDPKLTAEARDAIVSDHNVVYVSAASAWEIAIKCALGKLRAPDDLADELEAADLLPLSITVDHALAAGALPRHHHDDPFDRMLVAQAQVEDLTIVTADAALKQYAVPIFSA